MGQNQSQPVPYHRRHYNETNPQIQRQNSFSQSSSNLLLSREQSLKRDPSLVSNRSTPNLLGPSSGSHSLVSPLTVSIPSASHQQGTLDEPRSSKGIDPDPESPYVLSQSGAGRQNSIVRLLPIKEPEPVYYDEESDESDEDTDLDADEERINHSARLREFAASPASSIENSTNFNVNTRLGRGGAYEMRTWDLLEHHITKEEELEDLAHLSPTSVRSSSFRSLPTQSNSLKGLGYTMDHHRPVYYSQENSLHQRQYQPPNLGLDVCVIEDDEDGLKEEGEETEDDNDEDDNDEYFSGTLHSNKHFYYADDENSRQPTDFSSTHSTSDQNRAKLLHVIREDDEEAEGSTRQSTQSTSADERSGGISVPQQEANHSRGGSSNSSRLKDADNQPMQGPSTATSLSRSESQSLPSLQRRPPSSASFTSNTSIRSVDDLLGSVKTDFDKRIQQAVQEVEQKVMERVQKLEERAVLVAAQSISRRASARTLRNSASFVSVNGVPHPTLSAGLTKDSAADRNDEDQPIGQEMTDSVDNTQRKDDLSNVTLKVGDLDSRINEMEVLVSYKLVDIESQVQGLQNGLQNGQNSIIESVDQTSNPHNQQDTTNGIDDLDEALSAEAVVRYNSQYQDEQETIQAVIDLRGELQELGARYHELNGGLLEDLMSQLREAKLFLFDSVDEADDRLSKRVDRIEAEMHAKMLTDIENRIQERVHAMEQTSTRLERCFDKMEGRLGILEAVLHAKRGPGTLTLMETLAQSSLNQEKQRQQDRALEQELQPQEQEKQQVQKLQKLTGTVIGFAPAGGLVPSRRADQHTATSLIFGTYDPTQESSAEEKRAQSTVGKQDSVRPLKVQSRSTLANIQSSPETPLPSAHGGPQDPKPTVPIWSTGPTPYPLPPPIHTASQQIPIRTAGRATDSQSRNSRAMTFGSLPTQSFLEGAYVSTESSTPPVIPPRPKRSMTSFNGAPTSPLTGTLTTKSNYIVVSGGSKSSTADKKVPRPSSSYKDLLHFWKAGGSTPDLLKPLPEPSSMPY